MAKRVRLRIPADAPLCVHKAALDQAHAEIDAYYADKPIEVMKRLSNCLSTFRNAGRGMRGLSKGSQSNIFALAQVALADAIARRMERDAEAGA